MNRKSLAIVLLMVGCGGAQQAQSCPSPISTDLRYRQDARAFNTFTIAGQSVERGTLDARGRRHGYFLRGDSIQTFPVVDFFKSGGLQHTFSNEVSWRALISEEAAESKGAQHFPRKRELTSKTTYNCGQIVDGVRAETINRDDGTLILRDRYQKGEHVSSTLLGFAMHGARSLESTRIKDGYQLRLQQTPEGDEKIWIRQQRGRVQIDLGSVEAPITTIQFGEMPDADEVEYLIRDGEIRIRSINHGPKRASSRLSRMIWWLDLQRALDTTELMKTIEKPHLIRSRLVFRHGRPWLGVSIAKASSGFKVIQYRDGQEISVQSVPEEELITILRTLR